MSFANGGEAVAAMFPDALRKRGKGGGIQIVAGNSDDLKSG